MLDRIKEHYNLNKNNIIIFSIGIAINVAVLFTMNLMSNIASFWSPDNEFVNTLPDLFFDMFNKRNLGTEVDVMLYINLAFTALATLLRRDALSIYFRIINCISFSYLLRMTTVSLTNLPDPNSDCVKIMNKTLTETTYQRCGDNIFSGHTLIFMICCLSWSSYKFISKYYLNLSCAIMVYVLSILGIFGVLISRYHYSIDILLAIYITIGVWFVYGYIWHRYCSKDKIFSDFKIRNHL